MDELTALKILESLRTGEPEQEHVLDYTAPVRLESSPLKQMTSHLDDLAKGVSMVRFINGAYGEGKSHTLALFRRIALDRHFVVSSFSLEANGVRFDRFDRVFGKMIERLSTQEYSSSTAKMVLESVIEDWAKGATDVDRALDEMELDPTIPDLRGAISTYSRILIGKESREKQGKNRIDLLRHWFMPGPTGLLAAERRLIGVLNSINSSNAMQMIEGLALFFRKIGYAGWVVLVDEQEIIPTLMTETQRDRCNENLRLLIGAANQKEPPRSIYYVFASAPEFFTDLRKGVNAYPALQGRIMPNAVLTLGSLGTEEMTQVCKRLHDIMVCSTGQALLSDDDIALFASAVERRFRAVKFKARGFVQSFIALMAELSANPDAQMESLTDDVLSRVFRSIDAKVTAAK